MQQTYDDMIEQLNKKNKEKKQTKPTLKAEQKDEAVKEESTPAS
jgi:hypothetical protein